MATDTCKICTNVIETQITKSTSSEPNGFCLHIEVNIFKKENKEKKKKFLQGLNKIVCALRNTAGGFVLLHISGQDPEDLFLGHFDELVTASFRELVQDRALFINSYHRVWEQLETDDGRVKFLHLTVSKSDIICTANFNTKVCTDHENTDASLLDILSILSTDIYCPNRNLDFIPKLRNVTPDVQLLHENRSIELKRILPEQLKKLKESEDYTTDLVDYIWSNLKFKHSLTSMSKVARGGSFYVGVGEDKKLLTLTPVLEGLDLGLELTDLREKLNQKLESQVCAVSKQGAFFCSDIKSLDLITVGLHPIQGCESKIVLEISVRYFDGIVFYEKRGPRAYKIKKGEICNVDNEEWFEKVNGLADRRLV